MYFYVSFSWLIGHFTLLVVITLQWFECHAVIEIFAVEEVSINVNILCDLDQRANTILYWKIRGLVFDLNTVPEIFVINGHESITLLEVDRRMNEWEFECLTVNPTNERGLNLGQTTTLKVIYDSSKQLSSEKIESESQLLTPSMGTIIVDYQELQVGQHNTTLAWKYHPGRNTCSSAKFQVDLYSNNSIDAENQQSLQSIETNHTTVIIRSQLLKDENYFRISALNASNSSCATSQYFQSLSFKAPEYVNTSFQIPQDLLQRTISLQLIWFKDEQTQCACPPVENLMSACACNNDNSQNKITIDNIGNTNISNLTRQKDYLMLYLVSSISNGCQGNCNIRSVVKVYKINLEAAVNMTVFDDNTTSTTLQQSNNDFESGGTNNGVVLQLLATSTSIIIILAGMIIAGMIITILRKKNLIQCHVVVTKYCYRNYKIHN